ncbi:hypothetical protein [Borrelia sp. RT1S]|uniref:hypothetical protein n=1 Tax=Borrelia sp. RT1S TaxID=2898580 RepID=UPI001E2914D9|nr:hypothetical protein [Borrelia sp. RT1S]UGQ17922.1 hypothetical protein LSO05_05680 [Borrelia sp. RT1S]
MIIKNVEFYKVTEVVKILKANFNFEIAVQNLYNRARDFNVLMSINGKKYIPKDVIPFLAAKTATKSDREKVQESIDEIMENIRPVVEEYVIKTQQETQKEKEKQLTILSDLTNSIGSSVKKDLYNHVNEKFTKKDADLMAEFKQCLKTQEERHEALISEFEERLNKSDGQIESLVKQIESLRSEFEILVKQIESLTASFSKKNTPVEPNQANLIRSIGNTSKNNKEKRYLIYTIRAKTSSNQTKILYRIFRLANY